MRETLYVIYLNRWHFDRHDRHDRRSLREGERPWLTQPEYARAFAQSRRHLCFCIAAFLRWRHILKQSTSGWAACVEESGLAIGRLLVEQACCILLGKESSAFLLFIWHIHADVWLYLDRRLC